MLPLASLRTLPVVALSPLIACAQTPAPTQPMNFDDCLITHMAASAMLEDASEEKDIALRAGVLKSQVLLLADDMLDEDAQAARNASLLQSYGRAAERAVAEAVAINTAPQVLAAEAIFCGRELAE